MFYVYAIKSEIKDWIYVGLTSDIIRRVKQHNSGYNKSTKHYKPFLLIYFDEHQDRISARNREEYLAAKCKILRARFRTS